MRTLPIVFILSLVLTSSVFARGKERGDKIEKVMKSLNLSEDQYKKLKEYKSSTRSKYKGLRKEIKKAKESLRDGFINNVSDSELKTRNEKVLALRSQMTEKRFNKVLFLKNLLNDEQRKKYMEMKSERRGKWKNRGK